jgi:hypothetical protein
LCRIAVLLVGAIVLARPAGAVTFAPPVPIDLAGPGVGDRLVASDVSSDCAVDLLATRDFTVAAEDLSLNLLRGNGAGGFPNLGALNGGVRAVAVALGDLDGDGASDLVTAENFEPQTLPVGICQSTRAKVPVLRGNGAGAFTLISCLTARDHPSALAMADFDRDGHLDIVVANAVDAQSGTTSPEAVFFHGVGDGSFLAGITAFSQRADDLAVADLNRDGIPDLAVAGRSSVFVFFGNGNGTFTVAGPGKTGSARRVALGDIDADGDDDIAAVGSSPSTTADDFLWIALNDGAGGFAPTAAYLTGTHPVGVALADLDLDGGLDVVVANNLSDNVSVYLALPGGTLSAPQAFAAGPSPMSVVAGDFDKNGYPDIAVGDRNLSGGNLGDGIVSVLIQQVSVPLEVVTTVLPCAPPGLPYAQCLASRGGTSPYAWSIVSGLLPPGLVLNGSTGRIAGSPGTAGTSTFTAQATDAQTVRASRMLSLTVDQDADGDGRSVCGGDCNDADAAVWSTPSEVAGLAFLPDKMNLTWSAPSSPGGTSASLRFDSLRSSSSADFVAGALCVESNDGPNTTSVDAETPTAGSVFYYLVRARNVCPGGIGALGHRSDGTEIAGRVCP